MKKIFLMTIALLLVGGQYTFAHIYDSEGLKLFINLNDSSKRSCTSNNQCRFGEKCLLNKSGEGVCVEYRINPFSRESNEPFIFFEKEGKVGKTATTQKNTLIKQSGQPAQVFSIRKDPLTNRTTVIGQEGGQTKALLQGEGETDIIFYKTIGSEPPLQQPSPNVYNKGLIGPVREFYANGKLKLEASYKEGRLDGPYREYYPNGKLKLFENWSNGQRHGMSVSYFEDGQVKSQLNYQSGVRIGPYRVYNEDGTYTTGK